MDENDNEWIIYYIMNKRKVWDNICEMKNPDERFEMIEKLLKIEASLENMREE